MELNLRGRRVLVTGGSQGIGYAVAEGFLEEGCSVVYSSASADAAPGDERSIALELILSAPYFESRSTAD